MVELTREAAGVQSADREREERAARRDRGLLLLARGEGEEGEHVAGIARHKREEGEKHGTPSASRHTLVRL